MPDDDVFLPIRPRKKKRKSAFVPESFSTRFERVTREITTTEWMRECRSKFEACFSALGWPASEVAVLCLGLGSPNTSASAMAQLAFLASLCATLSIANDGISVFDPQFDQEDVQGLLAMGFHVLTENKHGRHALKNRTMLFMPHCEIELYENVLRENWHAENLGRLLLFGNILHMYTTGTPEKKLKQEAPCISRIWMNLHCDPIPSLATYPYAFNHLGLQYIDVNSLPACQDQMWELPRLAEDMSLGTEDLVVSSGKEDFI